MTADWRFISRLVTRRAGFPIEQILQLACDRSAASTDRLLDAEDAVADGAEAFLAAFNQAVAQCRTTGDSVGLGMLSKVRKRLAAGHVTQARIEKLAAHFAGTDFAAAADRYCGLLQREAALLSQARSDFARELSEKRRALLGLFRNPWLREAIFTSNAHAFENGIEAFLQSPPMEPRSGRAKTMERRLITYLQRFCAKNDTASFFGPMNYGVLGGVHPETVRLTMAPGKVRERKVFHSFWMVAVLAEQIARDPAVRDHLKPRLHPYWRLDGTDLMPLTQDRRTRLPETAAAVLRRLDGNHCLAELRAAAPDPAVFDRIILMLEQKGVVQLAIPLPSTVFDPFEFLHGFMAKLPGTVPARATWLSHLGKFQALLREMASAPFAERRQLTGEMEALFSELTRLPARRMAGMTYADRTLYYEECNGTITELSFNQDFTRDLVRRLEPVMALCGSWGQLLQRHYQKLARRAFRRIAGGRSVLPYGVFISGLEALETAGELDRSDPELEAFHAGLNDLAARQGDGPVVRIDRADLAPLLSDDPGLGLHTSPDLMLAATDVAALGRLDYRVVLGEVHQFLAMWGSQLLFDRDQAEVVAETEALIASLPNYQGLATVLHSRRHKGLLHESFPGTLIELMGHPSGRARDTVALRDLEVADTGNELVLRSTGAGRRVTLYNSGDDKLHLWAFAVPRVTNPPIGGDAAHTPRIEIGEVVYQRERWRLGPENLPVHDPHADEFDIFRTLRRLQRTHGLPRFSFIRLESEKKPIFLDLDNFFLCELLYTALPLNRHVIFTEMLPGPEELWLRDEAGRYCAELRGTAFRVPRPAALDGFETSRPGLVA